MFEELDVVEATRRLSDNVPAGSSGTIVMVHHHPEIAYLVEFTDDAGNTLDILDTTERDIKVIYPGGITSA